MAQNPSKAKIICGYVLLIGLLIASICYINGEVRLLTRTDNHEALLSQRRRTANEIMNQLHQAEIIGQSLGMGRLKLTRYADYKKAMKKAAEAVDSLRVQFEDSLQQSRLDTVSVLLLEKERNMRNLLRNIQESGTDKMYREHIARLIAEQDSLLSLPYLRHKVVTRTSSYTVRQKPKGFFRRLGEVFAPERGDSTQVSDVIQEEYTDTLNEAYSPADTLATLLKDVQSRVEESRQQHLKRLEANIRSLQLNGLQLNRRVSQLLNLIEDEDQRMMQDRHSRQEEIRQSSARTVAGIAIVAILLASVFLTLIWRDITKSNHYRKELEKAKQRAENLLVAREKLMLAITHDIKAPVGSILGYADLLSRLLTEERPLLYVHNMQSSANHLLALVNSLLDYHRLDAQKMEVNAVAFHPRQLFDTIITGFRPSADKKHLELRYEADASLDHTFVGDPFRIRQIVENLLSNALKFTSKGNVTLSVKVEGSTLNISVCDTGCGIAPEERKRVFQEFTRLHNAQGQEGFGLGLAITQRLIRLMSGDIRVESEAGKGSCFRVFLPLRTVHEAASDGQPTLPPLRILLIDDDRIQLQLTSAMLDAPGIRLTLCERPDELFSRLKETDYDVLLTDIQMPAMNGFDLLKVLRELPVRRAKTLPVIALTARTDMDEAFFRSQGFAGCLFKPFTRSELIRALSEVCPQKVLDFSALTAFSADDPQAASEIMHTFVSEARRHLERLKAALKENRPEEVAEVSHKLLPLFRMLKAETTLPELTWLEARRNGGGMTDEAKGKISLVIRELEMIIHEAKTTY